MGALHPLLERLSVLSKERHIPLGQAVEWTAAIVDDLWCFSPELISLYGTPAYEGLSEVGRKRLSFFEAINFFSLNIHGEKALIEGIARRLHRGTENAVSSYLHHFLDEENKHIFLFASFCRHHAGKIYHERTFAIPRSYAPGEEDFLFFAKALLFEEVVNVYNLRMARDPRLAPLLRAINLYHHRDEARHLAFGRTIVVDLFARFAPQWPRDTLAAVRRYLADYLESLRGEYFNTDVYRDAAILDAPKMREIALLDTGRQRLWRDITANCRALLRDNKLAIEEEGA